MTATIQATSKGNCRLSIGYNQNSRKLNITTVIVESGNTTIELGRVEAIEAVIKILNEIGVTEDELEAIAGKLT